MSAAATIALTLVALMASIGFSTDPDTDGDGLSDFREVHKHGTDPANPDSDNDGVPDGDWRERREFAYTVRAVMHVIKPINAATLTDDYQDGRVLDEHDDHVEIEVVLYPFNTVESGIGSRMQWFEAHDAPERYLSPGPTTNWDAAMRSALHAELAKHRIDLAALSDKDAVAKLARYLMRRVNSEDSFTTFAIDFDKTGRPVIPDDMRAHWKSELAARQRTLEQQLNHELYGKGMFENRTMGTCTSAAIYMATGMKAAGIPARSIICIPVTDGNDDVELELAKRLQHHGIRRTVVRAHRRSKNTWTSHTFNEVHVGGRWVRLNYHRLGQNILDEQSLGLMVHVNTYADHAQAGLAAWGRRNGGDRNDVCGYANPYSCISLSDRFGPHCKAENPPAEPALKQLTIKQAYWFDHQADPPRIETTVRNPETAGHFLLVVEEIATFDDYNEFYEQVDKTFHLVGPNQERIQARAARGFWIDTNRGIRDFYVYVPPDQFQRIVPGAAYRLVPHDADRPVAWRVDEDVRLVRPKK